MAKQIKDQNDLTSGPIMRKLMRLAIPIIGSQALQMLYNLTDMFWLGRLGSGEVAATGAVGLYMWLSVAFMYIGSIGASIGVSQAVGSGDREKAKVYANTALTVSAALGVMFAIVMTLFRRQMVGFFNFSEREVVIFAQEYLSIVAITIPLTYLTATMGAVFTASGNSRVPFGCNAIGTGVNVILDPILIFTLGYGVMGAAYATVIAQTLVFVLLSLMFVKSRNRPFQTIRLLYIPRWKDIMRLVKKTLPICTESLLFTFLVMVTSRREASFGADAMAMSRIGSQIESLTWLVGGAFGSALISFIGQNYGAGKRDRIITTHKLASLTMICYGMLVSLLLAVPGKYLFGLFLPDPVLIERSVTYLRILAICQIPMCLEVVSSNTFRGLGRTLPPAIVGTTCNIIRVPLAYLLSADDIGIGLPGVWIAISASACLKGIWSYTWYILAERKRKRSAQAAA
jgi:putative MATE family efflux protein